MELTERQSVRHGNLAAEHEQGLLDTGQFLLDRDGIVRWVNLESAREGLAGLGKFPSDEELLAMARRHAT